MYDLPLNAIRAFCAVYQHQGIRSAARAMGVAHSSVVRSVRQLEDWLGTPLMEKSAGNRQPQFSRQGKRLAEAGLESFGAVAHVVAAVKEARDRWTVMLSTTPSFATRWLMPRLADFYEHRPDIQLSIVVEQQLTRLSESEADLCIRMGQGPWPNGESEPLMDDLLFPVVSEGLLKRWGKPTCLEQLGELPLLHDRDPNAQWAHWRRAFPMGAADLARGPRYTSSDLVLRAASKGLGMALARARLAEEDLQARQLIRLFPEAEIRLPNAYWLVLPDYKSPSQATRVLIAWLKQQVEPR